MERGRILILGQSKETTYELRKLLDCRRFELEIALTPEVGKQVLVNRQMNLIVVHSEMLEQNDSGFLQFLQDEGLHIPIFVMGEDPTTEPPSFPSQDLHYFAKPYIQSDLFGTIDRL